METYEQMYDRQFAESLEFEKHWKSIVHSEKDLEHMKEELGELRIKHANEFKAACNNKEFREGVERRVGCKLLWTQVV